MICLFVIIILFALQLQLIALIFLKGLNPLLTLCAKIIEWLANHDGTIEVSDFTAAILTFGSIVLISVIFIVIKKRTLTNSVVNHNAID